VLQLASEREPAVGASPYPAIAELAGGFALVDPAVFRKAVEERGFRTEREQRLPLASGKAFWWSVFRRVC
jgi:hypothetical protein